MQFMKHVLPRFISPRKPGGKQEEKQGDKHHGTLAKKKVNELAIFNIKKLHKYNKN